MEFPEPTFPRKALPSPQATKTRVTRALLRVEPSRYLLWHSQDVLTFDCDWVPGGPFVSQL